MPEAFFLVDTFCDQDAAGNPGAVCVLRREASVEWMQAVAREVNQSETGFVRALSDESFALRWFTPTKEVPICGHVTLGAAYILWTQFLHSRDIISFATASGSLSARRVGDEVEIDLPANRCSKSPAPAWLPSALGIETPTVLAGDRKYLVVLPNEVAVRNLQPDFRQLRGRADRGVIVTAQSDERGVDFVSRYFAGYVGVDEDPVTGAAHCCLIPYWGELLSKKTLRARQLSPRGGMLKGEVARDRVRLAGRARTVIRGAITAERSP